MVRVLSLQACYEVELHARRELISGLKKLAGQHLSTADVVCVVDSCTERPQLISAALVFAKQLNDRLKPWARDNLAVAVQTALDKDLSKLLFAVKSRSLTLGIRVFTLAVDVRQTTR